MRNTASEAAPCDRGPHPVPSARIVFMTNELSRSGAETQLMLMARSLKRRGHDVRCLSILPPTSYVEEMSRAGVPVHTLVPGDAFEAGAKVPKHIVLKGVAPGMRLLRRCRTQALVCFVHEASLLGRLLGRLAGVPVVIGSERSVWGGGRIDRWVSRALDPLLDATVVNAPHLADDLVEAGVVPRHRVQVIPNGVDVEAIEAARFARAASRDELGVDEEFLWIAVGRLTAEKDHEMLLTAFARLREAAGRARLVVAGEGILHGRLEALAAEHGIDGQVRFLGRRHDIPQLLAASDGLVMTSRWEGLPNAIMEACAARLPVVSTAVGAIPDLVEDGVTGSLVPAGDPVALAEAMLGVMALPAGQRARMGAIGAARMRARYGLDAAATAWETLITELAAERNPRPRRPVRTVARR